TPGQVDSSAAGRAGERSRTASNTTSGSSSTPGTVRQEEGRRGRDRLRHAPGRGLAARRETLARWSRVGRLRPPGPERAVLGPRRRRNRACRPSTAAATGDPLRWLLPEPSAASFAVVPVPPAIVRLDG